MPDGREPPSESIERILAGYAYQTPAEFRASLADWIQYALSEPGSCAIIIDYRTPTRLARIGASPGQCPQFSFYYAFECNFPVLGDIATKAKKWAQANGRPQMYEHCLEAIEDAKWQATVQHLVEALA